MEQQETIQPEALYRSLFPKAAAIVRRQGGDLETARDLFHDAVIIFLEKQAEKGNVFFHTSAEAYILGTVRLLGLRRQQSHRPLRFTVPVDELELPDESAMRMDRQQRSLLEQLQAAGQKCLDLLVAFYYRKESMQELAGRFGYGSIRSATVQKYKCLEKVRGHIRQQNISYEEIAC